MKIRLFPILTVCFLISFSACQKEVSWSSPPPSVISNDSVLLSKFVTLDTTLPAPFDSIFVTSITYDSKKRLQNYYDISRTGSLLDTVGYCTFFYNGIDTLPFKGIYVDIANDIVTDSYVFFDGAGRLKKDSVGQNNGLFGVTWQVNNYSYETAGLRIIGWFKDASGVVTNINHFIYQSKNGNNVLTQKDTTDFSGSGYVVLTNYQYDNHPNPFRKLNIAHYPYYEGEDLITNNWSTNNFTGTYTDRKYLSPPTPIDIDDVRYYYEYGSNGMPKIAREKEVINGTADKYVYFYTK